MSEIRDLVLSIPLMFIGRKWDEIALYKLVVAVIKQAVSSETLNECSEIEIYINKNYIVIYDNGRGLPIDRIRIDKSDELPALEHILSWYLKTNPTYYYYQTFGFLSYFGGVMNAVAQRLYIETNRDGYLYSILCKEGEIIQGVKMMHTSHSKGTKIEFEPDLNVFSGVTMEYKKIEELIHQLAIKCPNVQFKLYEGTPNGNR